jgi:hypothetical protein
MIWLFPYHIPYQPSTNIILRAKALRDDIGVSGWYGMWYGKSHIIFSIYFNIILYMTSAYRVFFSFFFCTIIKFNVVRLLELKVKFTYPSSWHFVFTVFWRLTGIYKTCLKFEIYRFTTIRLIICIYFIDFRTTAGMWSQA